MHSSHFVRTIICRPPLTELWPDRLATSSRCEASSATQAPGIGTIGHTGRSSGRALATRMAARRMLGCGPMRASFLERVQVWCVLVLAALVSAVGSACGQSGSDQASPGCPTGTTYCAGCGGGGFCAAACPALACPAADAGTADAVAGSGDAAMCPLSTTTYCTDCGGGGFCVSGTCPAIACPGLEAGTDGGGATDGSQRCSTNADCPALSSTSSYAACSPGGQEVFSGCGVCAPAPNPCNVDSDCLLIHDAAPPVPMVCGPLASCFCAPSGMSGSCVAAPRPSDCDADEVFQGGRCKAKPCSVDADCPSIGLQDFTCASGLCAAKGCGKDADCHAGFCVNNVCVAQPGLCVQVTPAQ